MDLEGDILQKQTLILSLSTSKRSLTCHLNPPRLSDEDDNEDGWDDGYDDDCSRGYITTGGS